MKKIFIKQSDFFLLCCYLRQIQLSLARYNFNYRNDFLFFIKNKTENPALVIEMLTNYLGKQPLNILYTDVSLHLNNLSTCMWLDIQANLLLKRYFLYERDISNIIILLKCYQADLKNPNSVHNSEMEAYRKNIEAYAWHYFDQLPKTQQQKVLSIEYYQVPWGL